MSKHHVKSNPVAAAPHLNENGISAKKAESCIAAGSECSHMDIGQSGSVPVGTKEVTAPHFDADESHNEVSETESGKSDAPKAESTKTQSAKAESAKDESPTGGKSEGCDSMKNSDSASCGDKQDKKSECNDKDQDDKASDDKKHGLDLGVAAGLALLVADEAAKALKGASKNWEDKIDAAALKAHETIESAQRAVKDPVGETLKQMDHLAHPHKGKSNKKKKAS